MQFHHLVSKSIVDDETSWCSTGLNFWADQCGLPKSNSAAARSWMKVGKETKNPSVETNTITVLWRNSPDSWQGHVGIFLHQDDKFVYLLGANQGDTVGVNAFDKNRVLAHRALS